MAEPLADAPGGENAGGEAPPRFFSDRARPPPQRPGPLVRAPGLCAPAEARPAPPALQNRRSWLAKVSPQKPSEPSQGSAPRAR